MTNTDPTTQTPRTRASRTRGWPDLVGYAAAGWAATYATLALGWTVTGAGFPFGQNAPRSAGLLRDLPPQVGAPLFTAVLTVATVLALILASQGRPATAYRRILLGAGWLLAAALLIVVPEPDLLVIAGYTPMLVVGLPFGWPPDVDYGEVFTWSLANQAWAVVGGFLLAGALLAFQRRTRDACRYCGRGGVAAGWTTPAAAARWGRWATAVAVVVPLSYAVTRIAWVLGLPLGASQDLVDDLHATDGMVVAAAGLAAFATAGAVLTVGLVRPWGERFPRWLVWLSGRRVPVSLAVVPAGLVSVLVTAAGTAILTDQELYRQVGGGTWSLLLQALWPVWGMALAAAALAYYLRRRGSCRRCGAGSELG